MTVSKWQCPQCQKVYDSPMVIGSITCNNRHKVAQMKLIEGQASKPLERKEVEPNFKGQPKKKSTAPSKKSPAKKTKKISTGKDLLDNLRIKK